MTNRFSGVCATLIIILLAASSQNAETNPCFKTKRSSGGFGEGYPVVLKTPVPEKKVSIDHLMQAYFGKDAYKEIRFEIADIKNGYCKFSSKGDAFQQVMALFRMKDGSPLLAYSYCVCGPICGNIIEFYKIEGGCFVCVTDEVLPAQTREKLKEKINFYYKEYAYAGARFVLPRYGTDIKVELTDEEELLGITLMTLKWNRVVFTEIDGTQ